MKKNLFAVICSIAAISCATEEVRTSNQVAITFENTFVDPHESHTKVADPTITDGSFDEFFVWGFMEQVGGLVFNEVPVSKVDGNWTYEHTQYWAPNHTYYFGALAPVENRNWSLDITNANHYGLGLVTFTNNEGVEDLIYASTSVKTPEIDQLLAEGMDTVRLTFSHLLSKLKFTFTNGFSTDNVTMKVSEIRMEVPQSATIDLAVENWWDNDDWKVNGTETATLDFADVPVLKFAKSAASANERLTIPAGKNASYDISFKVNLYVGDQPAMEVVKTATLSGVAFNMGRSYNIKADITPENLGLHPIEFEVEVNEWIPEGDFETIVNK